MLSTAEKIDPRVTRTRKLLFDAFKSLLAEKHFDDMTVQDIAARATINRATFYAHFVDKYALVDALIRDDFAQILQRRLPKGSDDAGKYLRCLFLAVTDHWSGVHERCQRSYQMFESIAEAQVKEQLRDHTRAWLLEHHVTQPRQRLELAATIISWSIYGAGLEWSKRAGRQSAEAFADMALPLIVASITALEE